MANVILTGTRRPAQRLRALREIVVANGGEVCLASFEMALLVNGRKLDLYEIGA